MNLGNKNILSILLILLFLLFFAFVITYAIEYIFNIQPPVVDNQEHPAVIGEAVEESRVTRVIDGDTIEIATGERVRYIGIDTPENPTSSSAECFALESYLKNQELVLNKKVRLEKDVSDTDRYGRLLRYVWLKDDNDELFVNYELVRQGYATVSTYPPDVGYSQLFIDAHNEAMQENAGLWEKCSSKEVEHDIEKFEDNVNELLKLLE